MSEGGSQSRGRYDDEDERYSRRSMGMDRDDDGRFMSDNGSSRSRFQGDNEHYGPRSLGSMGRDRDDEGRFKRRFGRTRVVAMAVGSAIRKAIPRPRAAAGTIRATAKAAGTAIRKAIRKPHAVVGRTAGASVRHATRSVPGATTRCSPAARRGMTMTVATAGMMTTSAAAAGMAAGLAIRKAIRKPRGAAGRTDAKKGAGKFQTERPGESLAVSSSDGDLIMTRGLEEHSSANVMRHLRECIFPPPSMTFFCEPGTTALAKTCLRCWSPSLRA